MFNHRRHPISRFKMPFSVELHDDEPTTNPVRILAYQAYRTHTDIVAGHSKFETITNAYQTVLSEPLKDFDTVLGKRYNE